jgi:hypothetical protein
MPPSCHVIVRRKQAQLHLFSRLVDHCYLPLPFLINFRRSTDIHFNMNAEDATDDAIGVLFADSCSRDQ